MLAALFDLDGVIVDSESSYTVFWESMENRYPTGIPDFAHAIKGTNLQCILSNYADSGVREDIVKRLHDFEQDMEYPLYDDVLDFLDMLGEKGIGRALVTSSDNSKMECLWRKLPQLRNRFESVVTGSMVTHSKPHPEGYLTAAAALGCIPDDCWVFEDSLQGLKAGLDSGATVIALTTTNSYQAVAPLSHLVIDGWTGFSLEMMLSVREHRLRKGDD